MNVTLPEKNALDLKIIIVCLVMTASFLKMDLVSHHVLKILKWLMANVAAPVKMVSVTLAVKHAQKILTGVLHAQQIAIRQ